jgi:hypothetical protein
MHATNRKLLLLVTALVEAATGLCLLILPAVLFAILLGLEQPTVDTIFVGRIAGAALLAIGIASWMARGDTSSSAQLGLLTGIFIYNTTTSMLLAFAGAVLNMIGVVLWPAVALHAILAVWCFSCLRTHPNSEVCYGSKARITASQHCCPLHLNEQISAAMNRGSRSYRNRSWWLST